MVYDKPVWLATSEYIHPIVIVKLDTLAKKKRVRDVKTSISVLNHTDSIITVDLLQLCMYIRTHPHSPGHPGAANEAWYWLKLVLRIG